MRRSGALLHQPRPSVSTTGAIYVADARSFRVRRIDTDGVISTVVGNGQSASRGRRPAGAALLQFQMPIDNPEPGGGLPSTLRIACTSSTPGTTGSGGSTRR
jgi:hypothetical protein